MSPSEFHSSRKFADTSFGRIAYIELRVLLTEFWNTIN